MFISTYSIVNQSVPLPLLTIARLFQNTNTRGVSWTETVWVYIGAVEIELRKGDVALVNGARIYLPYVIQSPFLSIQREGGWVVINSAIDVQVGTI